MRIHPHHVSGKGRALGGSLGAAFALALCGCASSNDANATDAAAATAQPTETVVVTTTVTYPPPCTADMLSIEIVTADDVAPSLKFTNTSGGACEIFAGYPLVTPLDASGEVIAPDYEMNNPYRRPLNDMTIGPNEAVWSMISSGRPSTTGSQREELPLSTLRVTLPNSDEHIDVPSDQPLYISTGEDSLKTGYVHPLAPEQDTKSIP